MEKISNIITPSTRSVWKSGETPKPRIQSEVNWDNIQGVGKQYGPDEVAAPKVENDANALPESDFEDDMRGTLIDTRA